MSARSDLDQSRQFETVKENAEADSFLPAAPEPYLTLPTTNYKTSRVFPRNTLPADYFSISAQHPHLPLIIMLVLTQLSVGAFTVGCAIDATTGSNLLDLFRPLQATNALVFGVLALAASTLHLGRPQYAFRGILGFRHSWLSREIVAFGLFAGLAVTYSLFTWLTLKPPLKLPVPDVWISAALPPLGVLVAATGFVGVLCSVMIYVFTKREFWNFDRTLIRFLLTSVVLGVATTMLTAFAMPLMQPSIAFSSLADHLLIPLSRALILGATVKLVYDAMLFRYLLDFRYTPMKRSAMLCAGPLRWLTVTRFAVGAIGGVLLPTLLLNQFAEMSSVNGGLLAVAFGIWALCLTGEFLERYLFFAAVSAPRMPGGVRG
ncbi:dimethyl sulfoxide reductase anchor subunit family protein [Thalassoglobus neptunius]|uniref:dimethyl sulfoxide reductase anchor subunit family protein n=1 Tax=Thalassoglobus neptunius TaxID=1938619 RepID=UPI001E2ED4DA|nr:DmsC/YnfH family molybdoenzyme membrane anchor subunit [Thalassoglobus neptunius]